MTSAVRNANEAWTATDATFGARLALIRQRMGWGNVKEAALACGIPIQTWRTWERDNVLPRNYVEACEKIAEKTGCDYGWLVDRRPSHTSGAPGAQASSGWKRRRGIIPVDAPTWRAPLVAAA